MKTLSGVRLLLVWLSLAMPLIAFGNQQMSWEELGFPVHPSDDPFFGLVFEQKRSLDIVLRAERIRAKGTEVEPELSKREEEARVVLQNSGLDIEQLIEKEKVFFAKLATQQSKTRTELDGRDIRIPGYVLPLEFDDSNQVTEFLLVPYAGACIHTPPPPPNQIIHVSMEKGFTAGKMFTPVWVSGTLNTKMSVQQVGLSDGKSEFGVGYTLQSDTIETYE